MLRHYLLRNLLDLLLLYSLWCHAAQTEAEVDSDLIQDLWKDRKICEMVTWLNPGFKTERSVGVKGKRQKPVRGRRVALIRGRQTEGSRWSKGRNVWWGVRWWCQSLGAETGFYRCWNVNSGSLKQKSYLTFKRLCRYYVINPVVIVDISSWVSYFLK